MSFVAVAILGSAALGVGASVYAANKQAQATQQASQAILQGQQSALGAQKQYLAPYATQGQGVFPELKSLLTPGPSQTAMLSQLPGFQFMQDWGQRGVAAQATTRGLGGNALAAGAEFATGLAQSNWQSLVNPLLDLYRTGAGAAGSIGSNTANIYTGGAQSQAQLAQGLGGIQAGMAGGIAGAGSNSLNTLMYAKLAGMYGSPPATPRAAQTSG